MMSVLVSAAAEYVFVQKVIDDQAVIVRSNGSTYLIEKGVGCLSLWRYEGKRVIVDSPGLFLGVGSRLVLPDADQECRIWNSKQIDAPATSPRLPSLPQAVRPADDEFAFYDSQLRAVAYLEPGDGLTFYLWSGEPVAYQTSPNHRRCPLWTPSSPRRRLRGANRWRGWLPWRVCSWQPFSPCSPSGSSTLAARVPSRR
jgi:hypothetical protein